MKPGLPVAAFTGFMGASLIRALGRTWRVRVIDEQFIAEARRHAPNVIFAFWHGRMLALSYRYRARSVHLLASEHRDGELMGWVVRQLGYGHVRGSSTRGGARAVRELVRKLEEGHDVGITVDGPKGPRHTVKAGSIEIAKLSGCAILPITASARRRWVFSSWDAFEVPRPFTRVTIRLGKPIPVPRDSDPDALELKRKQVEAALLEITRLNDDGTVT